MSLILSDNVVKQILRENSYSFSFTFSLKKTFFFPLVFEKYFEIKENLNSKVHRNQIVLFRHMKNIWLEAIVKSRPGLLSPVAYLIYARSSVIIVCRPLGK